ncbi:Cell division cycle 5-like protein [Camellia lanceoleosa]|uniref:Cell division cycle 5-like protein n=1 Tax=Camellia lanceoleosa TaxID=1840588 RepID=A0ACC0GLN4_9ERIC|nr:Cell division cycle 5-like protein [Camellia lanceoleosa]
MAGYFIKEEVQFLRLAMGHENESLDEFVEAHKTCLNDIMYFPTRYGYGLSSVARNMEKLVLRNEFENVKKRMDDDAKKAQRLEQKIKLLTNGYQQRKKGSKASWMLSKYKKKLQQKIVLLSWPIFATNESLEPPADEIPSLEIDAAQVQANASPKQDMDADGVVENATPVVDVSSSDIMPSVSADDATHLKSVDENHSSDIPNQKILCRMLMDTDLGVTQQDYVRTAQGSERALVSLINVLLDQAKIEYGKLQLEIYRDI